LELNVLSRRQGIIRDTAEISRAAGQENIEFADTTERISGESASHCDRELTGHGGEFCSQTFDKGNTKIRGKRERQRENTENPEFKDKSAQKIRNRKNIKNQITN
jgi:hypothetical protein